jgi:hypothetical protein
MSTKAKVPGGDEQPPGGSADEKSDNLKDDDSGDAPPAKGTVAYETYQKAIDEAKAAKKKVAEFEKQKREAEETKLKQDGEYKKLLDQRDEELKTEREKNQKLNGSIENSRKMSAFLGAASGEIPKQYWPLIDLEQIAVDPESGQPDEASIKKAVKSFEAEYPDVVKRKTSGKLPQDNARGAGGKLSYDSWLALPLDEQKKRMKDVDPASL